VPPLPSWHSFVCRFAVDLLCSLFFLIALFLTLFVREPRGRAAAAACVAK
jgi:hypothetical protein